MSLEISHTWGELVVVKVGGQFIYKCHSKLLLTGGVKLNQSVKSADWSTNSCPLTYLADGWRVFIVEGPPLFKALTHWTLLQRLRGGFGCNSQTSLIAAISQSLWRGSSP